jgi:hypothetical protein
MIDIHGGMVHSIVASRTTKQMNCVRRTHTVHTVIMNYKTPQYAKSTKGNYLSKFKKEMETRKTHFFLYPIIIIMVVLKTIQDNENDITIAYRDADGNLHRRFIDTAITVKEALELARQDFPLAAKEGDRAVLKFQDYRVVGDNVPLLPKATYLLSILVPQVGKEYSVEEKFPLLAPLNYCFV